MLPSSVTVAVVVVMFAPAACRTAEEATASAWFTMASSDASTVMPRAVMSAIVARSPMRHQPTMTSAAVRQSGRTTFAP